MRENNLLKENLLIGFEFEFVLPYTVFETEKKKIDAFVQKLRSSLKNDEVFYTNNSYDMHREKFYKLTCDLSIRYNNGLYVPLELITPIFKLNSGLCKLKDILEFLKKENVITNETTGLHVNLSFENPEYNKKIDPLKLIFLSKDEYKIEKFWKRNEKRKKEQYFTTLVDPNLMVLKKILKEKIDSNAFFNHKKLIKNYPKEILKLLNNFKVADKAVWLNKKQSVNLDKLFKNNYVEFRLIGGKDYHLKHDMIFKEINYFIDLILKSTDQKNNKECIKKMCRILNGLLFKNNNVIENKKTRELFDKYDYIFSNNEIAKYSTVKLIQELEKNNSEEIEKNLEKLLTKKFVNFRDFENTIKIFYLKLIKELDTKKLTGFLKQYC